MSGNINGTSATAKFGKPINVMMGLDGNLLVTDWANNVLRKVELPVAASINNISNSDYAIQISPNPFSNFTTIKVTGNTKVAEPLSFFMYDLAGKAIKVKSTVSGQQIIVDRGDLANGIYFYKLVQVNKTIGSGKLIVE
jgi:hypothetical protein